ncbi:Plasma membrane fusion protein PRM1 [Cladobotryum mycophilum]|uniref:Plasma membrane fusion protein PRM1 n=1 Tax=Cladobotryum mycophilum TaxID=491253 RepID=A0ABR0SZD3_9HYPO
MLPSRTQDRPDAFPDLPNTLHADPLSTSKLRDVGQTRADTAPYVTPYLSLQSRLSQIWINRWTVLLLLVLVRMVLLVAQLHENVGDAKSKALSACTKVEDVGSAMASMPHYLSRGVNSLAASGIEKTIHGMVEILDLVIHGVEALIIFYINFLTATYTCLLTALIHGSLDIVASVTEDATKAFNSVINGTTGEIGDIAGALQIAINKMATGIEDSVFGSLIPEIPTVNFTDPINKLQHFNLSSDSFVKDVQRLNDKIPTFEEVQNLTETAISFPFNILRKALNDSYSDYKFDKGVFPLAQKQQLTFCSDNNTLENFFLHLYKLIEDARIAFVVVLTIAAVCVMGPMAYLEIRRWRRQRKHDPMDVVNIVSHPYTSAFGIKLASRFKGKKQILTRWCIAYGTSPAALFVLSLALTGFFACICQLVLLKVVEKEVPKLSHEVGDFAKGIVSSLEKSSNDWSNGANGVIINLNNEINHDILDYVTNATDAVNNTLNVFLDKMEEGLEFAFNGTILLNPIKSVIHCVIGLKIESVQKGLTWVHDHAHVSLPLFPNDTFSQGANDSISGDSDLNTFLASPSSVTTDEVTGAVDHVTRWLKSNLIQEALITVGILLVYVIVVLIGVMRMLVGMAAPERGRAEGGLRYVTHDQPPVDPVVEHSQPHDSPPPWEPSPTYAAATQSHNDASNRDAYGGKMTYGLNSTASYHETNPYDDYEKGKW